MEIQFTTRIFKEGRTYVAHAMELDVSSCGGTKEKVLKNLKETVRLFLEEAEKMGTLDQILEEAGYRKRKQKVARPKFISVPTDRGTTPAGCSGLLDGRSGAAGAAVPAAAGLLVAGAQRGRSQWASASPPGSVLWGPRCPR